MPETACLLCEKEATTESPRTAGSVKKFHCDRCGEYGATDTLVACWPDMGKQAAKHLLSGLSRELYELQQEMPQLHTLNLDELAAKSIVPNDDDLDAKMNKLLAAVKRKSKYFGDRVDLSLDTDYPLAYAKNGEELFAFINQLISFGLLDSIGDDNRTKYVTLSGEGWKRFSSLGDNVDQSQGFVAAWFHESTVESIATIKKAIESCGFSPMCINDEHFKETLMDKALGEIRRSRFVVIDLTGSRPSVFYEAGFANALGIEAIYVYKDGTVEGGSQLEFYVRHYRCYKYTGVDDLHDIVAQAIRARMRKAD